MLVIILLTPLAFIKLTKKKIVFLAVLLPFIILSIQIVLGNIIAGTLLSGENEFSQSALGYAQSAIEVSFNWKWELITTLRYWSFYIALIYILYIFFIKYIFLIEIRHNNTQRYAGHIQISITDNPKS